MGKVRRMAGDFQRQFDEVVRESELEEVRKAIHSVREATPSLDLKAPIDKPLMLPNAAPSPAIAASAVAPAKPKPAPRRSAKPKKAAPKLSKKKPAREPRP
jgi:sec-independent protein translocase protein TatB